MLLSEMKVKHVRDIIVTRDMANLGIPREEAIQVISDIRQEYYYFQAENQLDYLIREKWPPNMKRHGRAIKVQTMTT